MSLYSIKTVILTGLTFVKTLKFIIALTKIGYNAVKKIIRNFPQDGMFLMTCNTKELASLGSQPFGWGRYNILLFLLELPMAIL